MKSLSHWGMFHCWEAPGLPPMVDQPERSSTYGIDTQQRCTCRFGLDQGAGHPDPYCPHYVEQRSNPSWVHVPIGNPYPITNYTLDELYSYKSTPHSNPAQIATYWPHEDDLKLTITRELK